MGTLLHYELIRQDLQDSGDFFCLHFQFPDEIENTKSLREGGEGTVVRSPLPISAQGRYRQHRHFRL